MRQFKQITKVLQVGVALFVILIEKWAIILIAGVEIKIGFEIEELIDFLLDNTGTYHQIFQTDNNGLIIFVIAKKHKN